MMRRYEAVRSWWRSPASNWLDNAVLAVLVGAFVLCLGAPFVFAQLEWAHQSACIESGGVPTASANGLGWYCYRPASQGDAR